MSRCNGEDVDCFVCTAHFTTTTSTVPSDETEGWVMGHVTVLRTVLLLFFVPSLGGGCVVGKRTDFQITVYIRFISPQQQEPTRPSKQPMRTRYLGHVTGYQPIRYQYFLHPILTSTVIKVLSDIIKIMGAVSGSHHPINRSGEGHSQEKMGISGLYLDTMLSLLIHQSRRSIPSRTCMGGGFIIDQELTETSKQPIRTRQLGHVTGYQPIRDQSLVFPDSVGSCLIYILRKILQLYTINHSKFGRFWLNYKRKLITIPLPCRRHVAVWEVGFVGCSREIPQYPPGCPTQHHSLSHCWVIHLDNGVLSS
eukprot:sb/3467145/